MVGLQLIGPVILRLVLGAVFFDFGRTKVTRLKSLKSAMFEAAGMKPGGAYVWAIGLTEMAVGLALVTGLFTRTAALISAIIMLIALILRRKNPGSFESSAGFLFLCLIIGLSLVITGPGYWALDLLL
jgi:putative oxidoreductase